MPQMNDTGYMTTCLLMACCSRAKRQTPELLPAPERYDGGAYRS